MKWKKRKAEIERLKKKHPVRASVGAETTPTSAPRGSKYPSLTSTGVCKFSSNRGPRLSAPSHILVDTLHKQGPMVLTRDELPWAGGRKP